MNKLSVERGFNGVAFVKLDNKPVLSISSYGNRNVAMEVIDALVLAPDLAGTLAAMVEAAELALSAVDAGQPIDCEALRRRTEQARQLLSQAAAITV